MKSIASASALLFLSLASPAHALLICGNDDTHESATWRIGDSPAALQSIDTTGAVWCDASGQELNYIEHGFTGLRMRLGHDLAGVNVASWENDDAVFILNNL